MNTQKLIRKLLIL